MSDTSWLWALFTVIAAASQTVRNAAQRELTATLGTVGATHVRFLFGFPFGLLFLAAVIANGVPLPRPPAVYWAWVLDGALTQIAATALMLAAMSDRSFVVIYAYIKTEPVQVALFGCPAWRRGDVADGGRDSDRDLAAWSSWRSSPAPPWACARRSSALPPARCSRSPPSAFAARF
jgi:hypothetical protein